MEYLFQNSMQNYNSKYCNNTTDQYCAEFFLIKNYKRNNASKSEK